MTSWGTNHSVSLHIPDKKNHQLLTFLFWFCFIQISSSQSIGHLDEFLLIYTHNLWANKDYKPLHVGLVSWMQCTVSQEIYCTIMSCTKPFWFSHTVIHWYKSKTVIFLNVWFSLKSCIKTVIFFKLIVSFQTI